MLPSHLYTPCRHTLCRCREFQSYRTLRAVFVTEPLSPFRIGLPQADNVEELVDLCLDHLMGKCLNNGQPVLPIFIATLRERYQPGDSLRDDLEDLHIAFQEALIQVGPSAAPTPRRKQLLFDRLLQLDFRPQVRLVRQVINEHRVAAFLIHGPPEHGQRTLAYRLARLKPEWETGRHIVIDAGSNGIGLSSRSLWRQLAKILELPHWTPVEELTAKVGQWWQTQDIIFIFHTINFMPIDLLSAWLEEFWEPLMTMANQNQHQTQRHYLLLFMIDYAGHIYQSGLSLVQYLKDLHTVPKPLLLPSIEPISEDELDNWIVDAADVLPTDLSAQALVIPPCSGIQELVYEKICEHCGFSWEGDIAR